MKTISKKICMTILCFCIAGVMCISLSAANITINNSYGSVSGFSCHVEHTTNGVRGSSEGNLVQSSSGQVSYYAYVGGSTSHRHLYAHVHYAAGGTVVFANISEEHDINSSAEITFNREYDATITMEELGYTGADTWTAKYIYEWGHSSSLSRMTIISGRYVGTGTEI